MANKENDTIPAPENWVDEFGDFLFGVAISRVNRPDIAEDLVQETFLRALRGYQKFRGDSQFRTWLSGILSNVIHDFYRAQHRERGVFDKSISDLSDTKPDVLILTQEQPDQLTERMEVWQALEHCLTNISNQSAEVFRAVELDGSSNKEFARDKGISENAAAVLLHRARKSLRECMRKLLKI